MPRTMQTEKRNEWKKIVWAVHRTYSKIVSFCQCMQSTNIAKKNKKKRKSPQPYSKKTPYPEEERALSSLSFHSCHFQPSHLFQINCRLDIPLLPRKKPIAGIWASLSPLLYCLKYSPYWKHGRMETESFKSPVYSVCRPNAWLSFGRTKGSFG